MGTTRDYLIEFDECGKGGQVMLTAEILYEFDPGERSFVYNQDQPYIGRDPSATILGVRAIRVTGENWCFQREERPDWFAWIDKIAFNRIMEDEDHYEDLCAEEALQ